MDWPRPTKRQLSAMIIGVLGPARCHRGASVLGLIFFAGLLYTRPEESFPVLAGMRLTLIVSLVTLVALWFQLFFESRADGTDARQRHDHRFGLVVIASSLTTGMLLDAATEISKLVILVLLVLNLVRTPGQYRALVNALLVFTTYLACYSIYLYATGQALQVVNEEIMRSKATGIFGDPNDLAATIVRWPGAGAGAGDAGWQSNTVLLCSCLHGHVVGDPVDQLAWGMLALLTVIGGFCLVFSRRKGPAIVLAVLVSVSVLLVAPSRMTNFDKGEDSRQQSLRFLV